MRIGSIIKYATNAVHIFLVVKESLIIIQFRFSQFKLEEEAMLQKEMHSQDYRRFTIIGKGSITSPYWLDKRGLVLFSFLFC